MADFFAAGEPVRVDALLPAPDLSRDLLLLSGGKFARFSSADYQLLGTGTLAQLPGIALRPLPVAPRQIPFHAGFSYFELDNTGELWKQLDNSGGLGIYVTGDFPALELSL